MHPIQIPEFEKTEERLIGRSIILYGPSKTGKTYLMQDLMQYMKKYIPNAIVIAPSDKSPSNQSYATIVPAACVHSELTRELLFKIWQRQSMAASLYANASSRKVLESLFALRPDPLVKAEIMAVEQKKNIYTANLARIDPKLLSEAERARSMGKFDKDANDYTIKCLKKHLDTNTSYYQSILHRMNDEQRFCFTFRKFNPNLLLVCDDVAAEIHSCMRDPTLRNMFYKNRHYYLTVAIVTQNEKEIDKDIRKQVWCNIFTGYASANHYFANNDFDKDTIIRAMEIAESILAHKIDLITSRALHYKQLVYMREENSFSVYEARNYAGFKFGMPEAWKLCAAAEKKVTEFDKTNPFVQLAASVV